MVLDKKTTINLSFDTRINDDEILLTSPFCIVGI